MIYFFAGFVLGEVFARVNHLLVIIMSVIAMIIVLIAINKFGQSRHWLVLPLSFYLGGLVITLALCDSEFEHVWRENEYEQEYVSVKGIAEKIDIYEENVRITLKNVMVKINDRWYDCSSIFVYMDDTPEKMLPGSYIAAYGDIKRLNHASNPGQFDAGEYYNAFNIEYTMTSDDSEVVQYNRNSVLSVLYRLRAFLQSGLERFTTAEDYEVLSAMLLGDKNKLGEELETLYQLNGIAHILTISGLHISMLGRGLYKLLRKLGGGFLMSSMISGLVISMYGMMTGLGSSSLRAIIMFIIMLAADCLGKSYDMTSAVCFAGALVLCEYPLIIYQFSFQMSVVCILAISMAAPIVCRFLCIENRILKTVVTGCVIQWCTIPILLYHMYIYPVFSVLANLVVIPLVELVMMSGFLSLGVSLVNSEIAVFLSGAAHYILLFYKKMCEFISGFEYALFIPGCPDILQAALYYMILLTVLGYMSYKISVSNHLIFCSRIFKIKKVRRRLQRTINKQKTSDLGKIFIRYIATTLSIAACVFILMPKSYSMMTIIFADVGQGDCILIKMPSGDAALVDCGSSNITNVGSNCIIPMLNYYGIRNIEYVFLSHADSDHINGVADLIEKGRVKHIILPFRDDNSGFDEISDLAEMQDISVDCIGTGDIIVEEDVSFICLHPAKENTEDENSSSMVLKLKYKDFSVIFTGDLDMKGEQMVLETADSYGIDIACNVLKVGHHGSKYSTGEAFLEYASPESSVISCSESNIYGHPSKEALKRLADNNSYIYMTKDFGAVILYSNGENYKIKQFRK